ncbi:MAG: DUF721 domain-containing protein [Alphaproteobacteria bacterium]|nr:DUF721 domain-containing protein [Alphaproteobacteria bacterium]
MDDKKDVMSPQRKGKMEILSMSMLPLIRNIVGKRGMAVADMLLMWEKIVGEQMAAYTRPEKLEFVGKNRDQAVLKLNVPNGAFALEVQHRKNFLIQKINTYFGYNVVADIRIMQDGNGIFDKNMKNNQPSEEKNLVSDEEQIYIEQLSEGIASDELKEKLVRLGKAVFNFNHK